LTGDNYPLTCFQGLAIISLRAKN